MGDLILVKNPSACEQPWPGFDAIIQPSNNATADASRPLGVRPLRVLVCDDCKDSADSFSIILGFWEHEVRVAYDGQTVLEITAGSRGYQPDVMLLDIAMPRMDGCQLARLLRKRRRFRNILLIAITGYADQARRLLCGEAGYDRTLIKPVEPATLQQVLLAERDRLTRTLQNAERKSKPLQRRSKRSVSFPTAIY